MKEGIFLGKGNSDRRAISMAGYNFWEKKGHLSLGVSGGDGRERGKEESGGRRKSM